MAEAVIAEQNGAHRLELCADLIYDGLTPDFALVKVVLETVDIPVRVMIRCRKGDFTYSTDEINQMCADIVQLKQLDVDGFVFGAVRDGTIDEDAVLKIAQAAHPISITFHKAVDTLDDLIGAVHLLKTIDGVSSILTSGGKPTALKGAEPIAQMIAAAENILTIVAAGKVTNENRILVHESTGANELHGRRIVGYLGQY